MAFAAAFGLAWVAEHLIEVASVSAACGVLSVAAVVWLVRWCDRRDSHRAAQARLWTVRADAIPPAAVTPQVTQGTVPPAIVNNYYVRIDPADREVARIIRTALPGTSGNAAKED